MEEHSADNRKVIGSNPIEPTKRRDRLGMSLDSALFAIVVGDPQTTKSLTALQEGLNRLQQAEALRRPWYLRTSGLNRHCARGCLIKRGEKYYRRVDSSMKLCFACSEIVKRVLPKIQSQPSLGVGFWNGWKITKANKEHECTRGCAIKAGEHYFDSDMKVCARCMAMILFFNNVEALPGWLTRAEY